MSDPEIETTYAAYDVDGPIVPERFLNSPGCDALLSVVARHANARGWGVAQLAAESHMDPELTARLFDANAEPNTDDMDRWAAALGLDFQDLVHEAMLEKQRRQRTPA